MNKLNKIEVSQECEYYEQMKNGNKEEETLKK
jgi:hypothetical protein